MTAQNTKKTTDLLYLDTETFSPHNLKTCGTHKYAEGAEIIMWQYAINDGPVVVDDYLTDELHKLLQDEKYTVVIHNSHFDRTLIRHVAGIEIPVGRIFDTMVCAMAHSLPGGLGQLSSIFGMGEDKAKCKKGTMLIKLFCEFNTKRNGQVVRNTRHTHPLEWQQFREYGRLDIEAMRELYKKLPKRNMTEWEHKIWVLDQKINDRGVNVDLDLAKCAILATQDAKKAHDETIRLKTNGEVDSTGKREALLEYLNGVHGAKLDDLRSSTVREKLLSEIPTELAELLEIRIDASKTSSAKYKRVINCTSSDGRLRGLLQINGALRTQRWAGRLFQPQNLPRPLLKKEILEKEIFNIKMGYPLESGMSTMEVCSSALRGVICAPTGKKLIVSDLSNIEGRLLAWLAGQKDKLRAFADYDAGKGADLYKVAYSKAFGVPVDSVDDDMRQTGKVMELAFGYQGGVGAWITFAKAFGIDLEVMADKAYSSVPEFYIRDSMAFLKWINEQKTNKYGLSDKAFVVCNSFKLMWREAHAHIASYWRDLEQGCIKAMESPGSVHIVGMHKIKFNGSILMIGLPSGRFLYYIGAQLLDGKITYMGVNQFTHKWERLGTYGGKLAENITQAVSRDVLAHGMLLAEDSGYQVVLTTHDEIVAEVPDSKIFDAAGLETIMSTRGIWFADIPLSAKGFETFRYGKE